MLHGKHGNEFGVSRSHASLVPTENLSRRPKMSKTLMSLSAFALAISLAAPATAYSPASFDLSIARAERPEKPEKPQKRERIGALEVDSQLAREATERPRGRDNERPGDRQRRGGRGA